MSTIDIDKWDINTNSGNLAIWQHFVAYHDNQDILILKMIHAAKDDEEGYRWFISNNPNDDLPERYKRPHDDIDDSRR